MIKALSGIQYTLERGAAVQKHHQVRHKDRWMDGWIDQRDFFFVCANTRTGTVLALLSQEAIVVRVAS